MCALEREEQFAEHQCCLHSKEQPAHPGAVRSSFVRGQVETLGTGYWVDGKQVCEKSFPSKGSGDSLWVSSSRTGFKYWSTVINDVTLGLMLVSQVSTAALHPMPSPRCEDYLGTRLPQSPLAPVSQEAFSRVVSFSVLWTSPDMYLILSLISTHAHMHSHTHTRILLSHSFCLYSGFGKIEGVDIIVM